MATEPIDAATDVGPSSWWVCTDRLNQGGRKIIGPFESRNLALEVRGWVEKASYPTTYWVDQEGV